MFIYSGSNIGAKNTHLCKSEIKETVSLLESV